MISKYIYIFGSVILVSLVAVIAILPLLIRKEVPKKFLLILLSISVGSLLGTVFVHFLPEAVSHGYTLGVAIYVLAGFLTFFILEKLVHWHHCHNHIALDSEKNKKKHHGHGHAYHLAPMTLIGDAVHNIIDGLVIAGSYLVSIPLGISATISVLLHELPQEIADVGILLYSGYSKTKAVVFNLISAVAAIIGAIVGIVLAGKFAWFNDFLIPFAAGNFLYIAASNLIPELHRNHKLKEGIIHTIAILVGIGIMVALIFLGPAHTH